MYSTNGLSNITNYTTTGLGSSVGTITIAGQTIYLSASPNIGGNITLTLNIPNASSSVSGLLTNTDWNTFNNKENAGIIYYNDNSNNKIILPPTAIGQKMSLINNGVIGAFDWVQLGTTPVIPFPVSLFKQMSDGNIWIVSNTSPSTSEIRIFDSTNTSQLGTVLFMGQFSGICQIKVIVEDDASLDYVYIGGEFKNVNVNLQNQFCITRVVRSTFIEDPLFDGSTADYGVDGTVSTLFQINNDLYAGGEYHFIEPTVTTAECIIKVTNCNAVSGTQTYTQVGGGVSTAITKLTGYADGLGIPILVMVGAIDFVDLAATPIPTSNIAAYDTINNVWTPTSGTVNFNNNINDIILNTIPPTHFIVTGLFTDYVRAVSINLSTETAISGITVSSQFDANSIASFANPTSCFAVDFWYEINPITFTGVQKPYTSITPTVQIMCSGIINSNLALNWFNQSEIYEYKSSAPSQDCLFSIDQTNPNSFFIYGNVDTYISYLLTGRFQATYFTANEYNSILYWTPFGQPQGSFS